MTEQVRYDFHFQMDIGGILLADIVWFFHSFDICNLMTAGAKYDFNSKMQIIILLLANITKLLMTAGDRCK